MTRHIELVEGVGINAIYRILDDQRRIGSIDRRDRRAWRVRDYGYRVLAGYQTIGAAKVAAERMTFPTPLEVHEEMVLAAIAGRRAMAQRHFGVLLAGILARVIEGSNSARAEAIELMEKIDAYARGVIEDIDGIAHEPLFPNAPTKETT